MFAVQGNSHGRLEPCFHEREETRPTQIRLQPTGLCELEVAQLSRVLTMRDLPNISLPTEQMQHFPSSLSSVVLFISRQSAVLKRQSLTCVLTLSFSYQYDDLQSSATVGCVLDKAHLFTIYPFRLPACFTYFSSNSILTCQVQFKGKVVTFICGVNGRLLLDHLQINFQPEQELWCLYFPMFCAKTRLC